MKIIEKEEEQNEKKKSQINKKHEKFQHIFESFTTISFVA